MRRGRDAVRSVEEVISTKWSVAILRTLLGGAARFTCLREAIPGVSANILADRLRMLEDAGVLERARLPDPADRRVYRLTQKGLAARHLVAALDELSLAWGAGGLPASGDDECAS